MLDRTGLVRIGLAIPPLLVAWVIWDQWPLVPVWDQWFFISFFEKVATGQVTFADLVARHQGEVHHIVFPRLIFTALAFASGWSMQLESWGSLLLAVVTLGALLRMTRAGFDEKLSRASDITTLFVSALVFSLVQIWNWLWGVSLILFLVNACVVVGVEVLRSTAPERFGRALAVAGTCCFVASFSMAHGVLAWLAMAPAVLYFGPASGRSRHAAAWVGMTLATWLLFLWGYSAGDAPSTGGLLTRVMEHPLLLPGYFLILLGTPLGWLSDAVGDSNVALSITAGVGLGVIVVAGSLFVRLFGRVSGPERRAVVAWGCLGLFSLLYTGLNTVGRAKPFFLDPIGYELSRAWLSMYATPAGLLTIAATLLAARTLAESSRALALTLAGLLAVVVIANDVYEIEAPAHRERDAQTLCVELMANWAPANRCMNFVSYADEIAALESIGWRSPREDLRVTAIGADGRVTAFEPGPAGRPGVLRGTLAPSSDLAEAIEPGDAGSSAVLVSAAGSDRFFTYGLISADEAEAAATDSVEWEIELDPRALPGGGSALQVWLYERGSGRVRPVGDPFVWRSQREGQ